MELHVKKLALRSAAKVAFGSIAFGCGGSMMEQSDASSDATADRFEASALDAPHPIDSATTDDAALACTPPVEVDGGDPGEEVFQCCLGEVETLTGDAGFVVVDAGEITSDPSLENCCNAIIAHVDNATDDYSAASVVLPTCCNAIGGPIGPACTPWGPPMPPEMNTLEGVA